MKTLVIPFILAPLFTVASASALPPNYTYNLKCQATLDGVSANPSDTPQVLVKESGPVALYDQPSVQLALGPYSLVAYVGIKSFDSSDPNAAETDLSINLFQNGQQGANSENEEDISGLDFDHRPLNSPVKVMAHKFLNFQYLNRNVSRVDYTCALSRVK